MVPETQAGRHVHVGVHVRGHQTVVDRRVVQFTVETGATKQRYVPELYRNKSVTLFIRKRLLYGRFYIVYLPMNSVRIQYNDDELLSRTARTDIGQ